MIRNGYVLRNPEAYSAGDQFGISDEEGVERVLQFNESSELKWLEPQDDAVHAIQYLHTAHGCTFTVITNVSDSPTAKLHRTFNLEKIFGINCFNDIICLPINSGKLETLKKFAPGHLWIDDKPSNAEAGLEAGHRSILYSLPHNQDYHHPGIPRVGNWQHIISSHIL